MAGFFQNFLSDVQAGFLENPNLRDATHASKTFRTNGYGYAPKFKFLFHVYFEVNSEYIPWVIQLPEDRNFGLAVKNVQLPKYTFDVHTLNQYNRKRVVQTKIKYDPINIVFHDDNSNLIRKLWYNYYTYYYKDSLQADPMSGVSRSTSGNSVFDINHRNIYEGDVSGNLDWGYIGETSLPQPALSASLGDTKPPFFRAINIYGFNQHNFVLYRLINPMIESFTHDTYDYSQGNGIMENQMTLQYETVKYYDGAIDGKNPSQYVPNFGTEDHYDRVISPITRPGSQSTILGPGGLVDAAGGIMDDLSNGNILGAIQKAGVAKNTFKNPQNILNIAKGEVVNNVANSLRGTPNRNANFNFPSAADAVSTAKATVNNAYRNIIK
jgi:hypothetical protein